MTTYDVSIPAELRKLNTWMHSFGVNDEGEVIKRPRIAGTRYFGSKTTPAHWRTFDDVLAAMRRFGGYPYLVVTRDDRSAIRSTSRKASRRLPRNTGRITTLPRSFLWSRGSSPAILLARRAR
jgi:hypothetical protein